MTLETYSNETLLLAAIKAIVTSIEPELWEDYTFEMAYELVPDDFSLESIASLQQEILSKYFS